MREEHPCLFGPGIHRMEFAELETRLREAHPENGYREEIWGRYRALLSYVQSSGVQFEVWIAGSFTTEKPNPGDVDSAIHAPALALNGFAESNPTQAIQFLDFFSLANRPLVKMRYKTDAFLFPSDDDVQKSYWKGKFGFSRNEAAKGIVAFPLSPTLPL